LLRLPFYSQHSAGAFSACFVSRIAIFRRSKDEHDLSRSCHITRQNTGSFHYKYLDWKVQKNPKGPIPISRRSGGLNILHELAVALDNPSNAAQTNSLERQTSEVPI